MVEQGVGGGTVTATHRYEEDGDNAVELRVSDGDGGVGLGSTSVTVNNLPPTADAGGPYAVEEGEFLTLSGAGSDPAGANDPLTFEWDLDGDGAFDDAFGADPRVLLDGVDGPSTIDVSLRVTDDEGASATATATVEVSNADPTIDSITSPETIDEGSDATIAVIASDPAGVDDPLSFSFDCDNDGSFEIGPQPENSASCLFEDEGEYPVVVQVTDGDGGAALDSTTVTVRNVAPTAEAGGPYTVDEGSSLVLSGSAFDPGTTDLLTFEWDLDDDGAFDDAVGTSPTLDAGDIDGPELLVVSLRVTDGDGGEDTDSTTVDVLNADPSILSASSDGPVDEGSSANVTVDADDPAGDRDPLNFEFDCDGDGRFEVGPQSENSTTCFFGDASIHDVEFRITDDDGGEVVSSTAVTVNNLDPTADVGGPYTADEGSSIVLSGTGTDPAGDLDPLTFAWDLDNDGNFDDAADASPTVDLTGVDGPGVLEVSLRVSDGDGGEAVASTSITVNNLPPTITSVSNDGPIVEGGSSTITVTVTVTATDPASLGDPLNYEFDCDNDGTFEIGPQFSETTSCSFAVHGAYPVDVKVTDGDGGEAVGATTVIVAQALCNGLAATMVGTPGNDTIVGTPGDDVIVGLGGDDVIKGREGNDTICGGPGFDQISGGDGDDWISGDEDPDRLYGKDGEDTLYGGDGDDVFYGGDDDDEIWGGVDNDRLKGEGGNDTMYGGPGNDTISASSGDDKGYGDEGDDRLYGSSGNDMLWGGSGKDVFYGGSGDDTMYGDGDKDRLKGEDGTDHCDGGTGGAIPENDYASSSCETTANIP